MTITIITEPSVYLVGVPSINGGALDRFLDDHGIADWTTDATTAAEAIPECAGRLCYMSFAKPRPGGNAAYLEHIKECAHGSVLEHSVFNVIITGVSRSFTHELVRHRAGFGFSQLSQRFVDESDVAFVVPPEIDDPVAGDDDFDCWSSACRAAQNHYRSLAASLFLRVVNRHYPQDNVGTTDEATAWAARMIGHGSGSIIMKFRKKAREAARSVLPNCTETKIFVTANARSWRHFIEMRSDPGADAEMRRVAVAVLSLMQAVAPNLFGDYVVEDGTATTPYRKV